MTAVTSSIQRFLDVRANTEALAAPLSPEDQTVQSMPDVSPTKWHRAHTTWFFETFILGPNRPDYQPFHPDYGFLFNSYYEAVGPRYQRSARGCVSRPGCAEVKQYRDYVDAEMQRYMDGGPDDRTRSLIELGLHHEQQHQELLLMDIKHVLSMSPLDPPYQPAVTPSPGRATGRADWIKHDGGPFEIGHDGSGFAFDNEGPSHLVQLRPFAIADRLVTCRDWMQFIDDGGYRTAGLWLSDGWAAVQAGDWEAPLYWRRDEEAWSVYTLQGRRAVDPGEPVCHVSYYEADAFAAWSGSRLPTEFEWEAVARQFPGAEHQAAEVTVHPQVQSEPSLFGEAWAWTASSYSPYPGFHPAAGAVGEYNGKFMVSQQVLRGGSCATPPGHVRATYRNFFPPSARWPFTGLRLAKDT